jgi:hypothetical protein
MKKILIVLISIGVTFGLFWLTDELLTRKFEWWTIPILAIAWLLGAMGMMLLFETTIDSDNSKGEEDKRTGPSDEWPEENGQ